MLLANVPAPPRFFFFHLRSVVDPGVQKPLPLLTCFIPHATYGSVFETPKKMFRNFVTPSLFRVDSN